MTEDLHEHEMDGLFRQGLDGAEDSPSPGVWSAIEKGLGPAPPPSVAPPAGGGMHPLLLKGLAGAAILALVGTASYFLGRDSLRREQRSTPAQTPQARNPSTDDKGPDAGRAASGQPVTGNRAHISADAGKAGAHPAEGSLPEEPRPSGAAPASAPLDRRAAGGMPGKGDGQPLAISQRDMASGPTNGLGNTLPGQAAPRLSKAGTTGRQPDGATRVISTGRDRMSEDAGMTRREPLSPPLALSATEMADARLASPATRPRKPFPLGMPARPLRAAMAATAGAPPTDRPKMDRRTASRFSIMPAMAFNTTEKRIEENEDFIGIRGRREREEYAETESYGRTVTPGLFLAYAVTPRLSVQTGYGELRTHIRISPKDIRAVKDRDDKVRYRLDCSAGSYFIDPKAGTTPAVGDSIRLRASEVRTRYASIPVHLLYHAGRGKARFFALAGAEVNLLVNRSATTFFQNTAGLSFGTVRSEGLRPSTVNAVAGAGVDIGIGKQMSITVMPMYRMALKSPNMDGPVKTYPKTISVSAGIRIGF
jgi:hypothetical protein